nr:hypothetical protein [Tanacetum cinerariifolium]
MTKLAFCDYHNMIVILEKTEHNIDFHPIVEFFKASHIMIENTNEETKILTTVVGKPRTISESLLRRHLKQNDEDGISSLPDTELFENLSLMGYNILPNQRFTFQKGQFSHKWKVYNFSKMIFDGMVRHINTGSVSTIVGDSTIGVPNVSGLFPTVSVIFTTARVLARDSEIARLHAKEELKRMIEGLDRNNEVIAKHLQEYEQAKAELTIGEKLKLINELVKYQDHHAKILKYQTQQSRPLSKKEQKEFYMSVLRSHAGWKIGHLRGMTLEEIKEKFIPVWKQFEDFVHMSSKEEAKRVKRKGLNLDQGSSKIMKTSEDVSKEDLKGMMQLVPVEEVYIKALQVKHPIIDWEIHFEGQREY